MNHKTQCDIEVTLIQEKIYFIRGNKVMLSHDLAKIYEVEAKVLVQSVKRNLERFPDDFMFQLNDKEFRRLRSQIVTLDKGRGQYPKYRPYAFTEQGIAMLSSVLKSQRAIAVSILIMRVFVRLRKILVHDLSLATRIDELEKKYEGQFQIVFQAIRELIGTTEVPTKRRIGF